MSEKAETVTTRVGMASPPPGPAARQAPRHRRPTGASTVLATTVGSAVAFVPRSELVGYVRRTEGLALCGRGAACPG